MNLNLAILAALIALVTYGCSGAQELKSKSVSVDLNQVVSQGNKAGNIPPDFVAVTTDGQAVRLSDFARQKKPVIIYFMATWCPYCAEDYTELSKAYSGDLKNVSILSISLDLSENIIDLREYKKKYPNLQDTMFAPGQAKILVDYSITKTTTKYAIGKNGTIVFAGYGVFSEAQWRELLEKLLK